MTNQTYTMRTKVWLYPAEHAAWHFVTIPEKYSQDIQKRFAKVRRGWGSLPVTVTIGATSWKTSIFPDKKRGAYVLPLKAAIRKKENVFVHDTLTLTIKIAI